MVEEVVRVAAKYGERWKQQSEYAVDASLNFYVETEGEKTKVKIVHVALGYHVLFEWMPKNWLNNMKDNK